MLDLVRGAATDAVNLMAPEASAGQAATGRRMRDVMGHFATGVSVLTARDGEGRPVGTTANAISSVSEIVLGLARHLEHHGPGARPLLFYRGSYSELRLEEDELAA